MTESTTPDSASGTAAGACEAPEAHTFVLVEGGFEVIEGQIVGGMRDPDGQWDLDGVFMVRTEGGELIKVNGWNCITEVL